MWSAIGLVQRVFAAKAEPTPSAGEVSYGSSIVMADQDYDFPRPGAPSGKKENGEAPEGSDPALAGDLNRIAVARLREGKSADAERLLRRAAAMLEPYAAQRAALLCAVLTNLGTLHRMRGCWDHSRAALDRALKAAGKPVPDVKLYRARAFDQHGDLQASQGNVAAAMHWYREALALKESEAERNQWDVAVTLNKLAELYFRGRRYNEAEAYLVRSLGAVAKLAGWGHPALAKPLQRLAHAYARQRKHTNAEQSLRFALRLLADHYPEDDPSIIACLRMLSGTYRGLGRYAHARAVYELADNLLAHSADRRQIAPFESPRLPSPDDYGVTVSGA